MAEYTVDVDVDVVGITVGPGSFWVEDNNYEHVDEPTAQQIVHALRGDYGSRADAITEFFAGEDFTLHFTVNHSDGRVTRAEW